MVAPFRLLMSATVAASKALLPATIEFSRWIVPVSLSRPPPRPPETLPAALPVIVDAFSESDLPYRVDVVDWAKTDAGFRKIIERDRVVVQEGASRPREA